MKIGFIGAGKLAEAMISGLIRSGVAEPSDIMVSDIDESRLELMKDRFSVTTYRKNMKVVDSSDITVLALKPDVLLTAASKLEPAPGKLLVTVAAGMPITEVESVLPQGTHLIRVMPNINCATGESCTAICKGDAATEEDISRTEEVFGAVGKTFRVKESKMDVVTALSGSGPAYVFMFIEALSDGAVLHGLPREQATEMAAQTVLGAASMVLESGLHPAELKDRVCSPGGTTIAAVRSLEENGFRSAAIEAVSSARRRAEELSD